MVEFTKGHYKEGIDNTIFIIPGIIVVTLVGFFMYKLVTHLRQRSIAMEEKKKAKQLKKEKEQERKIKKK